MYKDKLQNCSCNQFHNISTYKQVETNSMTMNRGGNNGSEKWIEKTLRLLIPKTILSDKVSKAVYSTFYSVDHFLKEKPAQIEMSLQRFFFFFSNFACRLKICSSGISLRFYVKGMHRSFSLFAPRKSRWFISESFLPSTKYLTKHILTLYIAYRR